MIYVLLHSNFIPAYLLLQLLSGTQSYSVARVSSEYDQSSQSSLLRIYFSTLHFKRARTFKTCPTFA